MPTLKKIESREQVRSIVKENSFYYDNDTAYMVELNKGFCFEEQGSHCFGENTLKKVEESLSLVELCSCAECAS